MNLVKKLIENQKQRPGKNAIQYFKGGHLYSLNWKQVYSRVEQIFQCLADLDIGKGDHVCIYSNTNKEWGFLDLAIMARGAVTVPVYHSSHIDDLSYILNDCKPKATFVENEALYKKLKKNNLFEKTGQIIGMNEFKTEDGDQIRFLTDLVSQTSNNETLQSVVKGIKLDDIATLIYTSGTSGTPKGVLLAHQQVMSSVSEVFPLLGVTDNDRTLTFLPFSHVLGRMELWGHYYSGYALGYAESIEKIKTNLQEIKPTVIVGVPRIFEKIYFGVRAQVEISKLKQALFEKALKIGKKTNALRLHKKSPSLLHAFKEQIAWQMVFSSIQNKLGGHVRFAISGGAPLEPQISDFFSACGVHVLEGYGLTETTGPIFVNTLFEHKNGTVGKAVGDVEIRFDDDGEILVKSAKVMKGYFQNEEADQEVFTADGYLRTGDIGKFDKEGFLKITDRKKNLIKTAGGKFVAPQKIENLFTTHPLIDQIHIHGDRRKFVTALITLDKDEVMRIKKLMGIESKDYQALIESEPIQAEVRQAVAEVNSGLASYETIKRFKVLDHGFTIEGGQLTPSLKMKRKNIDKMYKEEIEKLYL